YFPDFGEVHPRLARARRAGDGVAGIAQGLDVACRRDLEDLLAKMAGAQVVDRPRPVGRRHGAQITRVERAAAVGVEEDRDAAQPAVARGRAVAVAVLELRARDVELHEVGEVQPRRVRARRAGDGVAGIAQGLDVARPRDLEALLDKIVGAQTD